MRFVEFLKVTVMLSAAAATTLGAATIAGASTQDRSVVGLAMVAWWMIAALAGAFTGRRVETSTPIARLLAGARTTNTLPELRPGLVLINRLWPLLAVTVLAGALAFLAPQVPGILAGGPILLALRMRHQGSAVAAIEDRDGVRFYVRQTSPVRPIALDRTPGFKTSMPAEVRSAVR